MKYSLLAIYPKGILRPVLNGNKSGPRLFDSIEQIKEWCDKNEKAAIRDNVRGWQVVSELDK